MTRSLSGKTRSTSPVLPLSRPLMTTTLSPFLIFNFGTFALLAPLRPLAGRGRKRQASSASLENLGGEGDDLHEPARPQFAGHRAEDTGPDRLALVGDQNGGVAVEADGAAVGAADFLRSPNNDCAVDVALLDPAARDRLLDRYDDHVADCRGLAFRAAQHLYALYPTRAGIVGNVEICLHLDHAAPSAGWSASIPASAVSTSVGSAAVTAGRAALRSDRRPGAASAGPLITTQHLRLEIGRLSSIRTTSPERYLLSLSCAAYFFEYVTNFL